MGTQTIWTLGSTRARREGTRRGAQLERGRNKRKTNENARQVRQGMQTQRARGAKRPSTHGYSQQIRNERETHAARGAEHTGSTIDDTRSDVHRRASALTKEIRTERG